MMKSVYTLSFLLTTALAFGQGTFESTGANSTWSNSAAWTLTSGSDADGVPDADDDVTILAGHFLNVTGNDACNSLIVRDDASLSELTIAAGRSLTVTGNVQLDCDDVAAETYLTVNGTLNVGGTFRILADEDDAAIEFTIGSSGAVNINGTGTSFFRVNSAVSDLSFFDNQGTFTCDGNFEFRTTDGSELPITNEGSMVIQGDLRLRVDDAGSIISFAQRDALDINTDLDLRSRDGADPADLTLNMQFNGAQVNLQSAINMLNDGGTIQANAATASFTYDGTSLQTIVTDSKIQYHNLVIANSGAVASLDGNLPASQLLGNLTVNSGSEMSLATFTINVADEAIINGTLTQNGEMTTGGNFSIGADGTMNTTSSLAVNGQYVNSGAHNVTDAGIDCARTFTNNGTYTCGGTTSTMNVAGNWANSGTYTTVDGARVTLDGTSGTQTISGTTTFEILEVNNTGTACTNTGTILIQGIFDLDAGTFNTGNNMTFLSNASGTGQMDNIDGGIFSGTVTVERFIDLAEDGWREIASPVSGTTIANWQDDGMITAGFTGSDFPNFSFISVYTYNENNADGAKDNGWVAATNVTDATGAAQGHRYYLGTGTYTASVTGTVNTGEFSYTLDYQDDAGDADEEGWNLVGNPFACSIDWDAIDAVDLVNTEYTYYVFSASAGNYGSYTGRTGGSGTNGVNRYIPSSQGFWLHATSSGASLNLYESNKAPVDSPWVKSSNNPIFEKVHVTMTGDVNSYQDEAMLWSNAMGVTNAKDQYDIFKLYSPTDYYDYVPHLAFVLNDSLDMSMYSVAETGDFSVPLKAYSGAQALGNYTLDFSNLDIFRPGSCIQLEDLHTGTTIDLRSNPSYTFATSDTTTMPRFMLHVSGAIDEGLVSDANCAGTNDGEIIVEVQNGQAFNLEWTDNLGNVLQSNTNVTVADTLSNLAPGAYWLTSNGGGCVLGNNYYLVQAPAEVIADFSASSDTIYLSQGGNVTFLNNSSGATAYHWDFGDGGISSDIDPVHTYMNTGVFTVTLVADNGNALCDDNFQITVVVMSDATSIADQHNNFIDYAVLQDENGVMLQFDFDAIKTVNVTVLNNLGQHVFAPRTQQLSNGTLALGNWQELPTGVYHLMVEVDGERQASKVLWNK